MIDMCMCQKNVIYLSRCNRKFLILIKIRSLFHSTVNQNILSTRFKKMAASSHFMGCSKKAKSHMTNPFFLFIVSYFHEYFTISRRNLCIIFFSSLDI